MAHNLGSHTEGQSTHRPPLFDGSDYTYWKARMKIFIQAMDYEIWDIIENGPFIPMKMEGDKEVPKRAREFTDSDKKSLSMNAKAVNTLYCALNRDEFNRVQGCESAQDIWRLLEVTHEGTNQVKESKLSLLVHEYELFTMEKEETISSMFTRFTNITNGLKVLGKVYAGEEINQKILRCLPRSWQPKVTAIQEAKDLKTVKLEELIGSLMTHEITMRALEKEDQRGKEVSKKRDIALKASSSRRDAESEESDGEDEDEEDEDIALITRRFSRFLRKKKFPGKRPYRGDKPQREKGKEETCYECGKSGHFKAECPQLKKGDKRFKKKALKATWDEPDSASSSGDEETANLCFMAHENEVCSSSSSDSDSDQENDSMIKAFNDLVIQFKSLKQKYVALEM